MKKIITLSAFAFLLTLQMKAQQIPLYSQMYFMRMLYNPALTAYNGSTNVYGFYREQWTAMPGHPVTRGGLAEVSLWKDRIGTGLHVYNDNTDIIHRLSAQLYYAQKVRFAKDHVLSLGVSGGIMQTRIDYNNVIANDIDDGHLLDAGKSATTFDMNVGLAYQWKKLTVNFSIPQVLNTKARITSQLKDTKYSMQRHFIAGASYEISIKNEKYNIEPSILVKKGAAQPVQVDANIMANYDRMVYLGVGYRLDFGVAIMAAVKIAKVVTIGYGFDYPIQKKVQFSSTGGTHEVILGVCFDKWTKKKKDPKDEFVKRSEYDSLAAKVDSLAAKQDSTAQVIDSLTHTVDSLKNTVDTLGNKSIEQQEKINEQQEKIKDFKKQVDEMEQEVQAYKKNISEHPIRNFPTKVDDKTTAAPGDVLRLNNVNFERNSSTLDENSYKELDKLAQMMKNNRKMQVRVIGHTDYKASEEYNDWLSRLRARAVSEYLISKGIPASRVSTIGMGKRAPIADNETEEGRAQNRRVEIEITK